MEDAKEMIALLTNVLPIALGFFAKLIAMKSQASSDIQKLQLEALVARQTVVESARENERLESPMSALNRRLIIWVMLTLIVIYVTAPLLFNIQTAVPIVHEGISFLGFQLSADEVEYRMVSGLIKYDEVFAWTSLIVEMYFGASLAKGK